MVVWSDSITFLEEKLLRFQNKAYKLLEQFSFVQTEKKNIFLKNVLNLKLSMKAHKYRHIN